MEALKSCKGVSGNIWLTWLRMDGLFLTSGLFALALPILYVCFPPVGHPNSTLAGVLACAVLTVGPAWLVVLAFSDLALAPKHWVFTSKIGLVMRCGMLPGNMLFRLVGTQLVLHFLDTDYTVKMIFSAMLTPSVIPAAACGLVHQTIIVVYDNWWN